MVFLCCHYLPPNTQTHTDVTSAPVYTLVFYVKIYYKYLYTYNICRS